MLCLGLVLVLDLGLAVALALLVTFVLGFASVRMFGIALVPAWSCLLALCVGSCLVLVVLLPVVLGPVLLFG